MMQLRQALNKENFLRAVNFLFFYVGWGVCLEQAGKGEGTIGPLIVLAMFLFHLCTVSNRFFELFFVLSFAFLGSCTDTLYLWTGFIHYSAMPSWLPFWAPPWLISVWLLFGMSINHSLIWLQGRPFLSAVLGAWGAVASYGAAELFGACTFPFGRTRTLFLIGIFWLFITPLSLFYCNWLKEKASGRFLP